MNRLFFKLLPFLLVPGGLVLAAIGGRAVLDPPPAEPTTVTLDEFMSTAAD